MTKIHIMLDLETWGTAPGCDLRSIGATVFDPATGFVADRDQAYVATSPTFYIAVDNPSSDPDKASANPTGKTWNWDGFNTYRKYPLRRDPQTVQWWNDQSAEAQSAFANPVDLREGLSSFTTWLADISCNIRVNEDDENGMMPQIGKWQGLRLWAHGPAFDHPILAAAYAATGLPLPWHYRAPRDTRTVFDLAGIDDHSGFMALFNTGTHHNALDDAISQAKAVCAAWRVIHPLPRPVASLRPEYLASMGDLEGRN